MNKKTMLISAVLLIFAITSAIIAYRIPLITNAQTGKENFYNKEVKPSIVCAKVIRNCHFFNNINSNIIKGSLSKGDEVTVLQDKNYEWYLVEKNGKCGWVKSENIEIYPDSAVNQNKMTASAIEYYVNSSGFKSDTDYFVWVDIDRQRVNILKKSPDKWKLIKELDCATGKNVSPTVRGFFKIGNRGNWFYSRRLSSGAKYWVQFYNSYLFHSVAMDANKNITDPVIGEKRSSGCIRFSVADAKWFFDNIPRNTAVFVY